MKNLFFWNVTPPGSCKNRRFGKLCPSIIRVFLRSVRRLLQEPHGVTSQKTTFFNLLVISPKCSYFRLKQTEYGSKYVPSGYFGPNLRTYYARAFNVRVYDMKTEVENNVLTKSCVLITVLNLTNSWYLSTTLQVIHYLATR
jgi:hypothetical protein